MSLGPGPIVYTPVDHTAGMNADLISQFQGLPNIGAWINAFGAQLNDLDQFFGQLLTTVPLQQAFGAQLDGIGGILGQGRDGLSYQAYQALLQAKINQLRSQGTVENLIQILISMAGAQSVQVIEGGNADITVTAVEIASSSLTPSDVITAVYQSKPAGVNMTLNGAFGPAFQFDLPATGLNAGFDVGHLAGVFT